MIRNFLATFILAVVACSAVWARDLPAPEGDVILNVSGNIGVSNVDGTAQFDLAMLEALESTTFETSTIWTDGEITFEGVELRTLIDQLGITGDTLRATAINDYMVEIPVDHAVEGGPMVAYRMDGKTMSVRDKGPLWLVYPYDSDPEYRSEVVYSRSIWQLDRITAID